MRVRKARVGDIDEIWEIEKESFPLPWSLSSFKSELTNPFSHFLVAEDDEEKVAGYIVLWELENSLHIANIAVKKGLRRKGIGTLLIGMAKDIATKEGKEKITLEVRKSNETAIRFYEKNGFTQTSVIRGYYFPDGEDALVFEWKKRRKEE